MRAAAWLGAVMLIGSGCASTEPPPRPQVGNIKLVYDKGEVGPGHAVLVPLTFTAEGVQPGAPMVTNGASNTTVSDQRDFRLDLVDRRDRVLSRYDIADPRKVIVERHGWLMLPQGQHVARFPLHSDAVAVRVHDTNGNLLARADVSQAVTAFCHDHSDVRDC